MMELYSRIVLVMRILGSPGSSRGPLGTLLGPSGGAPGTPQGPPWTTKVAISTKLQFDCCIQILSLQRIIPRNPLDGFIVDT